MAGEKAQLSDEFITKSQLVNGDGNAFSVNDNWDIVVEGTGTSVLESQLYYTSVKVTPAELNLLNSSPKELIPAPGAGKAIIVVAADATLVFNTTAYTAGSDLKISYGDDDGNDILRTYNDLWEATDDESRLFAAYEQNWYTNLNKNVELWALSGNWLDGDSDIYIHLLYKIIDIGYEGTVEPGESATPPDCTVSFHTQSTLDIDGDDGDYFIIELAADDTFTFTNIVTGKHYYFLIKNDATSGTVTATLTSDADIAAEESVEIAEDEYAELAVISNGTDRIWQLSNGLARL
jgi:hypothetical protein